MGNDKCEKIIRMVLTHTVSLYTIIQYVSIKMIMPFKAEGEDVNDKE